MLKRLIKKYLRNYNEYHEDIIKYTIEVQRKIAGINMCIFFVYGIYMYIADRLIRDTPTLASWFYFFVAGVSLVDYILFKYYLPKHPNMAITAANIYIFLTLKGLNSVYTVFPEDISIVLIMCAVVTTAIINIDPVRYGAIITITTIVGLIEYFIAIPERSFISVLTRVSNDLLIVSFTVGINIIFSKLKYDEINYRCSLENESIRDPLTQLFNRKYIERYVGVHADICQLCAMVLIDLDNFKAVNDTFGHKKGDELLCNIAAVLEKHFQNTGCVARLGGDEFIIFLTRFSDREEVLKTIQELLKIFPINVSGSGSNTIVKVSASIGVAFSNAKERVSYEKLYKSSDKVMYKAKKSGKGKAVAAEDAVMKEIIITKDNIKEA